MPEKMIVKMLLDYIIKKINYPQNSKYDYYEQLIYNLFLTGQRKLCIYILETDIPRELPITKVNKYYAYNSRPRNKKQNGRVEGAYIKKWRIRYLQLKCFYSSRL